LIKLWQTPSQNEMEASTVLRKSYGSVGGGELRSVNSSSPQPIHLHPTLEALDVGPHAFRSSIPQPNSRSPTAKDQDLSQKRRLQCLSMPATLNSPLLRRNISSPGEKLKFEEHSTMPRSYDPSLCRPLVHEHAPDTRNGKEIENSTEETNKSESKTLLSSFCKSTMFL
jgi:hypothetical protein